MYKMYTVAEFRKNLREALNQAEKGEAVEITRHGSVFRVVVEPILNSPELMAHVSNVSLDGDSLRQPQPIKVEAPKKPVVSPLDVLPKSYLREDYGECKNGHRLDHRGKCVGRGCKYGY